MNKVFWEYLKQNTDNEFELIIIDNCSSDGSREFFENIDPRVKVIANTENYSYPHCQNQGIKIAKYDVLAFFNNDIIISPHWDSRVLEALGHDGRDVLSLASNDRIADKKTTSSLQRRWKRVKYPVMTLFGQRQFALRLMLRLCYGNWEKHCQRVFEKYGTTFTPGFSGATIVMNRQALQKLNVWDLTQQAADFDLFYQSCERAEQVGDIKPLAVVNGVFAHHYRRLTYYAKFPPFADRDNLSSLSDKWKDEDVERWKSVIDFEG